MPSRNCLKHCRRARYSDSLSPARSRAWRGSRGRSGVPAFISHTYVPRLRLRVNGELISESHGRIWGAGVPLLGIIGNDAHQRTLGSLRDVPFLIVQQTISMSEVDSVFSDQGSADDAIAAFSAQALLDGGITFDAPSEPVFEASFDTYGPTPGMFDAGRRQTSETEYQIQLADWADAREPLAAAMTAAIAAWMPYFGSWDLSSRAALERVHDDPVLREGRAHFGQWLRTDHPEWLSPIPTDTQS